MTFADGATTAIAAIVAFITAKQYLISRDQMRHELFERRFEVYKKIQIFLSKIMAKGAVDDELLPEFYDAMQKARFLFGNDINEYLEEIKKHAFAERKAHAKAKEFEPRTAEKQTWVQKKYDEIKWLNDQLDQLHQKFGRYMKFSGR